MTNAEVRRAYATAAKATMTLAAAARALEISTQTLRKWAECGYVEIITIGPPSAPIRRVRTTEVERLKKVA